MKVCDILSTCPLSSSGTDVEREVITFQELIKLIFFVIFSFFTIEKPEVDFLEYILTSPSISKSVKFVLNPNGFNIGANIGRVAGAGIEDHIHFHIVPRWNGDSNFMPVIGDVKVISQDLAETKAKLLQAYLELKR